MRVYAIMFFDKTANGRLLKSIMIQGYKIQVVFELAGVYMLLKKSQVGLLTKMEA